MSNITVPSMKLSLKEKIGYSLGDLSANLVFQTLMMFLLVFYTDVFGLSPSVAGTIIFIGGIAGASFNLAMGAIADRTVTRWGKFRPWILWTALPFGLMAILAFTTPQIGMTGKIIYASVTYFLLLVAYSANNLPYSALSGVMTGDMVERTSLSSYRFVAVTVAQFITLVLLLPLVDYLGGGDDSLGYQRAVILFAIIAVICFIITFLTTRERIIPDPAHKSSIKDDVKDLSKNIPWIIIFVVTTIMFVGLALRGGMLVYFFKDFVSESSLTQFFKAIGLGESAWITNVGNYGYSVFNIIGIIGALLGIASSKPLAKRFGKRDAFIFGLVITAFFQMSLIFYSSQNLTGIFTTNLLIAYFYGITTPLLWAMIGDVADYSEWKNKRRATGMVFSAMIFGLKAGLGIGGAIAGYILSVYGYNAIQQIQTDQAIWGIRMSVSIYTGILFLLCALALLFYKIDKKMELKIQNELSDRRAA